jgi:predicted nucleotidyltransferase
MQSVILRGICISLPVPTYILHRIISLCSMISQFVASKIEGVKSLMDKHRIRKGYLFGSSVQGNFTAESDIDILVEVDDGIEPVELGGHLWDLQFALEDLFGRKVDLFTTRALKNPVFIRVVNKTKQLVYER